MANGTKLRRIFDVVLSAAIILAGLCLMGACAGIYFSGGDEPYSREAVAAAFSPIAIPVYLCLVLIAAAFLLQLLHPLPEEKILPLKQHSVLLKRAAAGADLDNCDPALKDQILALRSARKKQSIICTAVLVLCAAVFLIYTLNGTHFHSSDINGSMIRAMWLLVPCLALSMAFSLLTVRRRCGSMSQETELLKQCPKKAAVEEKLPAGSQKAKYVLLAVAVGLLAFGFVSGGTADVLTKAVNICTECIGLG